MGSKILFNTVFINLEQVLHSGSFFAVYTTRLAGVRVDKYVALLSSLMIVQFGSALLKFSPLVVLHLITFSFVISGRMF